jgi:hypothetical protein
VIGILVFIAGLLLGGFAGVVVAAAYFGPKLKRAIDLSDVWGSLLKQSHATNEKLIAQNRKLLEQIDHSARPRTTRAVPVCWGRHDVV